MARELYDDEWYAEQDRKLAEQNAPRIAAGLAPSRGLADPTYVNTSQPVRMRDLTSEQQVAQQPQMVVGGLRAPDPQVEQPAPVQETPRPNIGAVTTRLDGGRLIFSEVTEDGGRRPLADYSAGALDQLGRLGQTITQARQAPSEARQARALGKAMGGAEVVSTGLEPGQTLHYYDRNGIEVIAGNAQDKVKELLGVEASLDAQAIKAREALGREMGSLINYRKSLQQDMMNASPEEQKLIKDAISGLDEKISRASVSDQADSGVGLDDRLKAIQKQLEKNKNGGKTKPQPGAQGAPVEGAKPQALPADAYSRLGAEYARLKAKLDKGGEVVLDEAALEGWAPLLQASQARSQRAQVAVSGVRGNVVKSPGGLAPPASGGARGLGSNPGSGLYSRWLAEQDARRRAEQAERDRIERAHGRPGGLAGWLMPQPKY